MAVAIETDKWGMKFMPRDSEMATWERGLEYIEQEGSRQIREKHGLSGDDLENLSAGHGNGGNASYSTGGYVFHEEVEMAENRPGLPKLEHLCLLALLEDTSPGGLLDRCAHREGPRDRG